MAKDHQKEQSSPKPFYKNGQLSAIITSRYFCLAGSAGPAALFKPLLFTFGRSPMIFKISGTFFGTGGTVEHPGTVPPCQAAGYLAQAIDLYALRACVFEFREEVYV